jgi:hypothetical protein
VNLSQVQKYQGGGVDSNTRKVRLAGEGSRDKTFEHLQNFPNFRESTRSGGGATVVIELSYRERDG